MSPTIKLAFAALVLILIVTAAGFALLNDYTQILDIFSAYFHGKCTSLQTTTNIELHGLNSTDLGELNRIINLSVLLSYSPQTKEYNQDNPDACQFLYENTTITIQKEKELSQTFLLEINDSHTFHQTIKLTSDGTWIIRTERKLAFEHAGSPYSRTSRNPDNMRSFKVLTSEELTNLLRSTRKPSFWENPVLIAALSAIASAIAALVVRIAWRKYKQKPSETEA